MAIRPNKQNQERKEKMITEILMVLLGMVVMAGIMYIVNKVKGELIFGAIPFALLTILGWAGLVLVIVAGAIYAFIEFGGDHIKSVNAKMSAHFEKSKTASDE